MNVGRIPSSLTNKTLNEEFQKKGTLHFTWIIYNVGLIKHNELKLSTGGLGVSKTKTEKFNEYTKQQHQITAYAGIKLARDVQGLCTEKY